MPRDCQAFATSISDGATALPTRPSTARPGAWNSATTRRNGTASLVASHGAKTTFGLLRCATPLIGARPGRSQLVAFEGFTDEGFNSSGGGVPFQGFARDMKEWAGMVSIIHN